MTTREQNNRICLGAVVGVHGIKGEIKVKSWTACDRDIGAYGVLEDKNGLRSFELKVTGRSKELLRCKIKGIDDRNAAEALIGTELYVCREALPELEEEEYYQADLIGLRVIEKSSGQEAGTVAGVYNFGAGDILEISVNPSGKTEMIPFTREYVPEVSVKGGYVTVSSLLMNYAEDDNADSSPVTTAENGGREPVAAGKTVNVPEGGKNTAGDNPENGGNSYER